MNKEEILAIHAKACKHAKSHTDSKGNGNADPLSVAFHMTRSEVNEKLQAKTAPPGPHPDDDGDAEMHHMRQKLHFKKLWKLTDELVAAAGLSDKGQVS